MCAALHVMGDGCGFVVQDGVATALYVASQNGHVDAVRVMLGAGAAVNQAAVSGDGRGEERGVFVCVRG